MEKFKMNILHYLYDPFCGWCYGAAPLLTKAMEVEGLAIIPHGIGMLSGDSRKFMSAEWRDFVRPHEERITAFSKQVFGNAYVHGLQERTDILLDSSIPTAAMLAALKIDGRSVEMLKKLQIAYYQEGRAIADRDGILNIAVEQGYDKSEFSTTFDVIMANEVKEHIDESHQLMNQLDLQGVPGLVLQTEKEMHVFPFGKYISRLDRFEHDLRKFTNPTL